MNTKLTNLKTELREFIELSKTISPGRWEDGNGAVWHDCDNEGQGEVCEFVKLPDATFIARARNISPAMAECLLVAVEGLESIEDNPHCHAEHDESCQDSLQQILNIWEAAK